MGLDGAEIVLAVEERFEVRLPAPRVALATTPAQLGDLVMACRGEHGKPALSRDEILRGIRKIVQDQTGVPDAVYGDDAPFASFGFD